MTRYLTALAVLLPLIRLAGATSSSASGKSDHGISRGGSSSNSLRRPTRPSWLSMDRETLQTYMQLAKERHAASVQKAQESYWSALSSTWNNDEPHDDDNDKNPLDRVVMDTYGVSPHPTWSLPDFADELDMSRMIFVTHGHHGKNHPHDSPVEDDTTPLLTRDECQTVIQLAELHFQGQPWSTLPSGDYHVAGFWIRTVPTVHAWFNQMVRTRLFPLLQRQFPDFVHSVNDLVVDNAYLFKYTPETGRRTDVHTDSGCLSFTMALNGPEDYTGGGTWFQGLIQNAADNTTPNDNTSPPTTMPVPNSLIEMKQGHVTVRPGGVRHCGHAVEQGTRYIIGGFCMHRHKVEYTRMLIGLGSERAGQGNYPEAQEALEAAIVMNPNFDGAYTHLANVLEKQGQMDKAQQVLEHCHFHVNPLNGEVAYSLGILYLNKKEYNHAKECFQACLEVDDCDADAMMGMAQACAGNGGNASENDAAPTTRGEQEWYERIVRTRGVSKETAASAYCNLGVIHQGDENEIHFYQKALELIPNNFQSRFSLASAHAARHEWPEAVASFRLAVDLATTTTSSAGHLEQALNALYRVAIHIVQQESQSGAGTTAATREAMIERLHELMGKDNYARLAQNSGQR